MTLFKTVIAELSEMPITARIFSDAISPWAVDILKYNNDLKQDSHYQLLPLITAGINRYLAGKESKGAHLAAIFAMVYLADQIHITVKDDNEGQEYNPALQFAILVGDYIFGKSMHLLGTINSYFLAAKLTELICQVNEGHAIRHRHKEDTVETLIREKVNYYKYSFLCAALSAGCSPAECQYYEDMGYNVGMAIALSQNNNFGLTGTSYLEKARNMLIASHKGKTEDKGIMLRILDHIGETMGPIRVAAVV